MNLAQKIKSQFDSNPDLRILFFFDCNSEYLLDIDVLEFEDIIIINAARDHFALKVKLENELKDKKVLLYFQQSSPNETEKKNFILLDLLFANKELLLDDVADFMNEYNLLKPQRSIVRKFIKDLKLKKNQKVISSILNQHDFTEQSVIKGIISSYLGFSTIVNTSKCLAKLFILSLPKYNNDFIKFVNRIKNDETKSILFNWFYEYLEFSTSNLTQDVLISSICKFKYNILVQNFKRLKETDQYSKLKINDNRVIQQLNSLLVEWQNDAQLNIQLNEVLSESGKNIQETKIIEWYGVDADFSFYTTDLKFFIIKESINSIQSHPKRVISSISLLSGNPNEKPVLIALMRFLQYAANFFAQLNQTSNFIFDRPEDYINKYAKEYSNIDFYYRKAVVALEELNKLTLPDHINLSDVINDLHSRYESYLISLNREWMECMKHFNFNFNEIPIPKQYDFYQDNVKESEQKVAVIISDALRYEVAAELLNELMKDTHGSAEISYCLSGLPSNTKWGMANLLSDKELILENNSLTIGSISTEGLENRNTILRMNSEDSIAVQYDKIIRLEREDIRETFKNQIVFIYHNSIDAVGDVRKTEMKTFKAVNETITELADLTKKIHSSYNVSRVLITSDHGFLFNYRQLSDSTMQDIPQGDHLVAHNRFIITNQKENQKDSYTFPLSNCSKVQSELMLSVPKSVNRYKRQGSGIHFVHGGASLQEVVLPVIESNRKRKEISQKVSAKVLNDQLKIVSGAIKINILQVQPVSNDFKSRIIIAGIYNSTNQIISNEVELILNSVSDSPVERKQEFILNLSSTAGNEPVLSLKVFDIQEDKDRLNPLINEKVINNTLIGSDF
jgi:uncharacterized protein (TIGR02687 family)